MTNNARENLKISLKTKEFKGTVINITKIIKFINKKTTEINSMVYICYSAITLTIFLLPLLVNLTFPSTFAKTV